MAIRDRHIPAKIDDVMLASPDVDVDVFANEIADMGDPHPNFTLFTSRDDHALAVSKWVWGNVARLGAIDPEAEPYKAQLAAEHVRVLDLTQLKSTDALNHSKFAASPEVVRLLAQRLEEGQVIGDSHEGLGDKIVGGVANGVSTIETSLESVETGDKAVPGLK